MSSVPVCGPKIPTWSVVWFASVPRSRAGRSAVTTTSGTPACDASSIAGCRLATAVPDVHITAARLPPLQSPSARNPAVRSSIRVCSRTRPASAASYAAKDSGALREPGASTISRTPSATSAVRTARASVVASRAHDRNPRTSASRASQCATRSSVAASRSSAAGSTCGRRTGRNPSTGSSGSATTSAVSSCTVARPQA